jgi:hypothetical protein
LPPSPCPGDQVSLLDWDNGGDFGTLEAVADFPFA